MFHAFEATDIVVMLLVLVTVAAFVFISRAPKAKGQPPQE